MDLFLVGDFDTDQIKEMVRKSFSRFPFAEGPRLEVPQVGITRSHKSLNAVSKELKRPLSEILIAWNTGVGVTHPQARTLLVLGEYINKVLFSRLREKFGDTYTPEASFKADSCSGIFEIRISSSNNPEAVERRIIEALATLKDTIDVAGAPALQRSARAEAAQGRPEQRRPTGVHGRPGAPRRFNSRFRGEYDKLGGNSHCCTPISAVPQRRLRPAGIGRTIAMAAPAGLPRLPRASGPHPFPTGGWLGSPCGNPRTLGKRFNPGIRIGVRKLIIHPQPGT